MNNKMIFAVISVLASGVVASSQAFAENNIKLSVDHHMISSDVAPYISNGSAWVPLTVLRELEHVQFAWNNMNKRVSFDVDTQTYELKIGDSFATSNNKTYPLTAKAALVNNHVMVPLRFIAELSGSTVLWNAANQTVFITSGNAESHSGTKTVNLDGTDYTVPIVSKEFAKYSFAVKTPEGIVWAPAPGKSAPNDPSYYPATPFVFYLSDPTITNLNVDQAKKLVELPTADDKTYMIVEDVNSVGDYLVYHTYVTAKGMAQSLKSQAWAMKVSDPGSKKEIESYHSAGGYLHYYGISQQDGLYVSVSLIPGNADGSSTYEVLAYTLASGEKKRIENYKQDENGLHFEVNNKAYTVQLTQV